MQERSLEERVYPSRRFDLLGLVQRRSGGRPGQRDLGAPGLGVYSAWLGGLPGFLSGEPKWHAAEACRGVLLEPVLSMWVVLGGKRVVETGWTES